MTRGKRARIGKGIYADRYGLAAVVSIGRQRQERRFPGDTDLAEIKRWQAHARGELADDDTPVVTANRGTLESDIQRYLKRLTGRPSYASDKAHLSAWSAYGSRRRSQIRSVDVAEAIAGWRDQGVAAQTIIHRCRVLRQLYHALDGEDAKTPVDGVKRPKKPKPLPITVPLITILNVHQAVKRVDPIAAARFWVLATTGQRPSQVMRTQPTDLDFRRGIWLVRPVKGTEPREVYLNPDMRKAWKTFIELDAWGDYDSTAFARLLRQHGWPANIRPYNLRHSFAVAALERGVDLGDVQGMLGHTEIETTRAFYAPILQGRLKQASQALTGRFRVPRRATEGATNGTRHGATLRHKSREKVTRHSVSGKSKKR